MALTESGAVVTPEPKSASSHAPRGNRWASDPAQTLRIAAYAVVIVAGSWWMLGQLANVLRPLLLAVFLGYVLLPYYLRLRRYLPGPIAVAVMAGVTTAMLVGLSLAAYSGIASLKREGRDLTQRALVLVHRAADLVDQYVPGGAGKAATKPLDEQAATWATENALSLLNIAALGFVEAATAGLYLLFLLTEAAQFPERVRRAYPAERAEHILDVFGRINAAVISFLKAKVFSSLILAAPVAGILAAGGVRFVPLWALLTFVCNFIPYVGSAVAIALPVGFTFLQLDATLGAFVVAGTLILTHLICASVLEPLVIGRAVGLSPLVILAALSIWGLLWGLPGMFLAVPLTVVLVLILGNIEVTRPVARLLGG